MSDNWIQFVPVDPTYQPDRAAIERAKLLLSSFVPDAFEVDVRFVETIQFFHPAGNWSGVNCPKCGLNVQDWWTKAMDVAFETNFGICGSRPSVVANLFRSTR
jgi:hypothetical protein